MSDFFLDWRQYLLRSKNLVERAFRCFCSHECGAGRVMLELAIINAVGSPYCVAAHLCGLASFRFRCSHRHPS